MLYVFHVDAGLMTTYDMNLTLESVTSLKAAIERKTKIPASSLVLLVSGGEVLQGDHMVSSYSAGTDTNPIYMFSKPNVKESNLKQSNQYSVCDLSPIVELSTEHWRSETRSGVEVKSVGELKSAVEMCCALPPSVQTVVTCATLAQQFSEHAREFSRSCELMVHDQHLQYQGWSAVVANLEDIFNEFCERSKNFKESFKKHRLKKDTYHEQLNALNEVLESLGKIPILPALRLNAEAHRFSAFDVFEEADFDNHYDRLSGRLDNSSENKGYQDFGVEAFKMSEEDVFNPEKQDVDDQDKPVEDSDDGGSFKARSYDRDSNRDDPTLLHWILAQGNKASLQDILDYCQKGLSLIDADPLKEREAELCHILEYANMHGLKQIKGIEDRLYGLDQLLSEVKRLERDQHDQAMSLIQNRERVSSACDPSVLPTLVQSHRYQLDKLLKNHQLLVDIRRRVAKSKEELSHILKARLEAVLMIENSMSVQDAHQMLSFQCFNRLARYFDIVEQLHRAPAMFVHAVHEVARRRTFSDAFLKWATSLATRLLEIHNEEVSRRQEFNTQFHGHFLKSLFPGMAELPPPFATQTPPLFDGRVPKLTPEDVELVARSFPDFAEVIPKYDMEATVKFFKQRTDIAAYEDKDIDVQADLDKVFESVTETGDFERLSRQSTSEKQKVDISTICVPDTTAVSTVTEVRTLAIIRETAEDSRESMSAVVDSGSPKISKFEFENSEFYIEESLPSSLEWGRDAQDNMDTHKINMNKLNDFLLQLFELCKANVVFIKEEISRLKNEIDEQKRYIVGQSAALSQTLQKSSEAIAIKYREETQRLTVDHELELADLKNDLKTKDDLIDNLKTLKENLKHEHQKEIERLQEECKNARETQEETTKSFKCQLEDVEAQKQKELKDLQDKMHQDYKAEIESMRSRFRLVALTNMDRSPSESSLEKIERTDVIEISSHNAIVMQTKENAELEKEEAIKRAVQEVTTEWQQKLASELAEMKNTFEKERQVTITDVTRRLLAEKDRQLELAQQREQILIKDCYKYKATIEQLTDPETNEGLQQPQLQALENEKAVLQNQLELSRQQEKELAKMCYKYKMTIDHLNETKPKDNDEQNRPDIQRLELEKAALQNQLVEMVKELQSLRGDVDSERSSSPKKEESRRSRVKCHTPFGLSAGTLSLSSCLPGHVVLVLWDAAHQNYTVMQEASVMYFVHGECLPALDLSINVKNEAERRLYAIATVDSKEFCYAKKSGNRYQMPRTSRFYRVRVKPYRWFPSVPQCCDHKHRNPDCIKGVALAALTQRPVKKWLTYMHAPDSQKSVDTSQSTSSATEEGKVSEVVTATLINLESPVSAPSTSEVDGPIPEEQHDSIEASDWSGRMVTSTATGVGTDMECSVGRVLGADMDLPTELTVSSVSVVSRSDDINVSADSELAEEATP